jgi:DNA-binding PadR family transcriptional regulator
MSEARLLALVLRYPHPTALARQARDGRIFPALRRLERRGLVTRRRGQYRLTLRGRHELAMTRAVTRLLARTHRAAG